MQSPEPVPDWFLHGVQAALLAPTAMNQQKFRFQLEGSVVRATPGGDSTPKSTWASPSTTLNSGSPHPLYLGMNPSEQNQPAPVGAGWFMFERRGSV